jgi:predicted secreted protein
MTEFTGQCMGPGKDPVPATPELWWSPILGAIINSVAGGHWHLLDNEAWPLPAPEYHRGEMPADAVKLGSVDALRAELVETDREWRKAFDELRRREREQAVQLNEIRDVLEQSAHWTSSTYPAAGDARTVARVRSIVEGE